MNKVSRLLAVALLGALLIVVISGHALADEKPRVRVVHATPSVPALNFVINDALFFANIPYSLITAYAPVDPGDRTVQVVLAEAVVQNPIFFGTLTDGTLNAIDAEATLIKVSENFETNRNYTVIVSGWLPRIEYWRLNDDNELPGQGTSRVRFVHAAFNTPTAEFCLGDVCHTVSFKQASNYFLLDPGTYRPYVQLNGVEPSHIKIPPLILQDDSVHTIFLTGAIQDTPNGLKLLYTLDNSRALQVPYPQPPAPGANLQLQPAKPSGGSQPPSPGSLAAPAPQYPPVTGAFLSPRAIGALAGLALIIVGCLGFWLARR